MSELAYNEGEADKYKVYQTTAFPSDPLIHETLTTIGVAGKRVLDYGCGNGHHIPFLISQNPASLTGCDPSEAMTAAARSQFPSGVTFDVLQDAPQLPYADNSFDVVLSSFVFHYIADTKAALREIARVIEPSGQLVAIFSDVHLAKGSEHLANTELPIVFRGSTQGAPPMRVVSLAKPGKEVEESAKEARLIIETYRNVENATIASVPDDYPHKSEVELRTGFLIARKP